MARAKAATEAAASIIIVSDPEPDIEPTWIEESTEEVPITFASLSGELAAADERVRSATAGAGEARTERSVVAVATIRAAYTEGLNVEDVRKSLLDAGVLKGTVSKIATVLLELKTGTITLGDVKSLNGAYSLIKAVEKATAASGGAAVPGAAPAAKPATTPEEALALIVALVTSESDPDTAYVIGGEWITKVTNAITAALRAIEDDEEGLE